MVKHTCLYIGHLLIYLQFFSIDIGLAAPICQQAPGIATGQVAAAAQQDQLQEITLLHDVTRGQPEGTAVHAQDEWFMQLHLEVTPIAQPEDFHMQTTSTVPHNRK